MKSMKRFAGLSIFAYLLLLAPSLSPAAADGTMLWISDMHFDPFFGGEVLKLADDSEDEWRDHTEWSSILEKMPANQRCSPSGSDANHFLLQKVLDGAKQELKESPDCILITGDFISHDFSNAYFSKNGLPNSLTTTEKHNRFIDETFGYLALSVSRRFPGVPVIATLGNNDAYCGDYDIRGNSGFLTNTARTFRKYFLSNLSDDFENVGGCYSTNVPGTKHKFVVLNSVPFISDYPEAYRVAGIPQLSGSCLQLRNIELVDEYDWLTHQMEFCADGQRVWLTCHIPPGVACYDGSQNWPRPVPSKDSTVPFVNMFRDYYVSQREHFAGVLTGHSHAAEFKLIRDSTARSEVVSSVLMAPSIGRNHANNASFRVVSFDRESLAIRDYVTHWLDGTKVPASWGVPFQFTTTYGQKDVSPQSLQNVYEAMNGGKIAPTGRSFVDQYFFDYSTRNGSANSKSRSHYKNALGTLIGP